MTQLKSLSLPIGLSLLMVLTQLTASFSGQYLAFQREAIFAGQWWRLLSGHFFHLSWTHLIMNLVGLLLIWAFAGSLITTKQWLLVLVGCAITTSLGLLLFAPELIWYVGLSGVLHGLLVIVGIKMITCREPVGWLILAAIIAKVSWEQWAGPSISLETQIGGNVIVDAHLYGALSGVLFGTLLRAISTKPSQTDSQAPD